MKFMIYAAAYNANIGGVIAMHKLCHFLNELGYRAYIQPIINGTFPRTRRIFQYISPKFPIIRTLTGRGFRTNPEFNTPLLPLCLDHDPSKSIAVYSETTDDNPLKARNIVRWFLHRPGFHTGRTNYGANEFHVDFNQFLTGYDPGPNHLSPHSLFVVHFPFDLYNFDGALLPDERTGVAFCVRKGNIDPAIDLKEATNIDGLEHEEISQIFKRVKYFYSFDLYTAYSHLAALCGAISFVIPPPGMDRDAWYANDVDRYGVGFGLDDEVWARTTQDLVLPTLKQREQSSLQAVSRFAKECLEYFSSVP